MILIWQNIYEYNYIINNTGELNYRIVFVCIVRKVFDLGFSLGITVNEAESKEA